MNQPIRKHNVCGILISVHSAEQADLLSFLYALDGCEVIEYNDNKIAATVEDIDESSAYDLMETIKDHSAVLSITLVNHFFEEA